MSRRIYDDVTSDRLSLERWAIASVVYEGQAHRWADANAAVRTGDGVVEVAVKPFTRWGDTVQMLNNGKHLLLSSEKIATPAGSVTRVATSMAVTTHDAIPFNLRAAFTTGRRAAPIGAWAASCSTERACPFRSIRSCSAGHPLVARDVALLADRTCARAGRYRGLRPLGHHHGVVRRGGRKPERKTGLADPSTRGVTLRMNVAGWVEVLPLAA